MVPAGIRIARDWQTSPRLLAALDKSSNETLATSLHIGELLGTLSLLESQTVIAPEERLEMIKSAGLSEGSMDGIWARIAGTVSHSETT